MLEWDLDGDNQYDDAFGPTAQTQFDTPGNKTVRLQDHRQRRRIPHGLQDPDGLEPAADRIVHIQPGRSAVGSARGLHLDVDRPGWVDRRRSLGHRQRRRLRRRQRHRGRPDLHDRRRQDRRLRVTDDDGNPVIATRTVNVTNRRSDRCDRGTDRGAEEHQHHLQVDFDRRRRHDHQDRVGHRRRRLRRRHGRSDHEAVLGHRAEDHPSARDRQPRGASTRTSTSSTSAATPHPSPSSASRRRTRAPVTP